MSTYTRALYLKNNTTLTLTEEEFVAVKKIILSGAKFISVQGEIISTDSISRVGSHLSTPDIIKYEESNRAHGLPFDEKLLELREKMKIKPEENKVVAVRTDNSQINYLKETVGNENTENKKMDDEDNGEPFYWVDSIGQKHYS